MEPGIKLLIKAGIYYGSFLAFPFLALLLYYRHKIYFAVFILLTLLTLLFIWSRFIEPNIIVVRTTTIPTDFDARVTLIGDTHLGVYKGKHFLKRVVSKINKQQSDYVLIAGDFTYEPQKGILHELFEPLRDIQKPVYAVLGNHDVEQPGPPLRQELLDALIQHNVTILNNERVELNTFTLVGLGDNWSHEDNTALLDKHTPEEHIVVLTHNPDTTLAYTNNNADVTLTGHTHCGQIRIPLWYKHVIPTRGDFDKGLTEELHTTLYITCGLGEVGLPMRLFNPPVIDVIEFKKEST